MPEPAISARRVADRHVADRRIAGGRLAAQRIAASRFEQPADVVRWMGAMQAQDYLQAVWGIGARTAKSTLADVEQTIAAGSILRTWPMRGTIHFVPTEDARWMVDLSAPRMLHSSARRRAQLELDEHTLARCEDVVIAALEGGRRLPRPDILALLEENGIRINGQRGYHILYYLSQRGVLYIGPTEHKQQTFGLLADCAPDARELPREEALAELARRYFISHGPATVYDFAWWAGLTVGDARLGLEGARAALESATIEGQEYWMQAGLAPISPEENGAWLLAGFDEYLLGYKDRGAVLAPEHAQQIVPGNNGFFRPLLVVEGQVVGTWKRQVRKKAVSVTLQPFTALNHSSDLIAEAAQAYADFIGLPLALETVPAG
ncbi:MAG: AlkZ family DNA glycosylase [Anaerolineae bacterium]|nr:AlkZ family DNA glycosylase [Anaerolineae bacterium]